VCNARAVAAGLSGTFVAWMSDDNDDAYCRVHGLMGKMSANCGQVALPIAAGPWIRTDGFPFSATIDQLLSPTFQVYSPLRFDEFGALVPASFVFASTTSSGSLRNSTPCTNWTSNSMVWVRGGFTENTTGQWTDGGSGFCASNHRIICMESGVGGDLPDFTSSGKQAFVTSTTMNNGNLGGLAGADAICQGLAMTAGLTGTFKAWLSDTGTDAIDRFTSDGPWVRLDGVKIADNKADLIDGTIFTGLDLDEQNNYIINNAVWTGTTSSGVVDGSNHCNSWTDGTAGFNGTMGGTSKAGSAWTFFSGATSCDSTYARLYCLED
jgi:hypothetical protein